MKITPHPLESRIAFIHGVRNLKQFSTAPFHLATTATESQPMSIIHDIRFLFQKYALLVFKQIDQSSPEDILGFMKLFDEQHDPTAFENIELCIHHPRPTKHYHWQVDMIGYGTKSPNIVSAFYFQDIPPLGGEMNFICGETIWEKMTTEEQNKTRSMMLEINRWKYATGHAKMDYFGINRQDTYKRFTMGTRRVPFLYAPEGYLEQPKVLITPSYFEKVVGMDVLESRNWIQQFMHRQVLPHHVIVQPTRGDLFIMNNRRMMYSFCPSSVKNDKNPIHFILPTMRPFRGFMDT